MARRGPELGGEDPEEGRLPRAVPAEEAEHLALRDSERDLPVGPRSCRRRVSPPGFPKSPDTCQRLMTGGQIPSPGMDRTTYDIVVVGGGAAGLRAAIAAAEADPPVTHTPA